MNFTTNIKRCMVLGAIGASLLLAGRASSQEIVNTDFNTPANSLGGNFNAAAPEISYATAATPQAAYTPATAIAVRSTEINQLSAVTLPSGTAPLLAVVIVLAGWAISRKISAYYGQDHRRNLWNSSSPRSKAVVNTKRYALHG